MLSVPASLDLLTKTRFVPQILCDQLRDLPTIGRRSDDETDPSPIFAHVVSPSDYCSVRGMESQSATKGAASEARTIDYGLAPPEGPVVAGANPYLGSCGCQYRSVTKPSEPGDGQGTYFGSVNDQASLLILPEHIIDLDFTIANLHHTTRPRIACRTLNSTPIRTHNDEAPSRIERRCV